MPLIRVVCSFLKRCEVQAIWNCTPTNVANISLTSISIHPSTRLQLEDRSHTQYTTKKRNGQIICDDELSDLIKLQANNMFLRTLSCLRRRSNWTLLVILPRQYHRLPNQKWRQQLKRTIITTIKAWLSSLKGRRHLNTKQFPSIAKLAHQNLEFAYIIQAQTK